MTLPNDDAPPKFWWRIKIACGAALIAIVVDQFIFHLLRDGLWLPIILGQAIAVTGGAITIYHHYILGKFLMYMVPGQFRATSPSSNHHRIPS